jgi:hypothetical protein
MMPHLSRIRLQGLRLEVPIFRLFQRLDALPARQLFLRIVAWVALAILYAAAFHYAQKYEADMLDPRELGQ